MYRHENRLKGTWSNHKRLVGDVQSKFSKNFFWHSTVEMEWRSLRYDYKCKVKTEVFLQLLGCMINYCALKVYCFRSVRLLVFKNALELKCNRNPSDLPRIWEIYNSTGNWSVSRLSKNTFGNLLPSSHARFLNLINCSCVK